MMMKGDDFANLMNIMQCNVIIWRSFLCQFHPSFIKHCNMDFILYQGQGHEDTGVLYSIYVIYELIRGLEYSLECY